MEMPSCSAIVAISCHLFGWVIPARILIVIGFVVEDTIVRKIFLVMSGCCNRAEQAICSVICGAGQPKL